MQPEDPKSDYSQPKETSFYAAPQLESQDAQDNTSLPEEVGPAGESEEGVTEVTSSDEAATESSDQTEIIRWKAAEYIHQEKSTIWFVVFGIVVVLLTVGAVFMQIWTAVLLIPAMAVALFLYTRRPPQQIDYVLSEKGLYINELLHPFAEFKGFGVIHDQTEYSVVLIPVRRFRPGLTVYFPEEAGEGIVDLLGARLAMQELHLDFVDVLTRKLRI